MTENIRQFDKHHQLYKEYSYESSLAICQNLVSVFKVSVMEEYENSKRFVETWEKDFFQSFAYEPSLKDMDEEVKTARTKFMHAKSLLKLWNSSR